jgi:hypothetical protein
MAPRKFVDFTLRANVSELLPIAGLSITQFAVSSARELARTEQIAITPMFKVPSRPLP